MSRRGFTLMELMVGLVVSAISIETVVRGYAMVAATVASIERRREESTRRMNAGRWLAEALGSVEPSGDSAGVFIGQADRVRCATWLRGPGGWPQRTPLLLRFNDGALRASTGHGEVLLAEGIAAVRFDYLLEPGLESAWVSRWESPVSAPFAIRIRMWHKPSTEETQHVAPHQGIDTLLVLIGGRG